MDSYLPISTLNKLVYCPRRFWYMYVQGELAINAPMLEGILLHERADRAGYETDDNGRFVQRRVWVWSDRLQIAGFADFVERESEKSPAASGKSSPHATCDLQPVTSHPPLIPVEYKHGRQGKWDNDNIQLCAQALCLEEMTGQTIQQGEIFYWRSRRRVTVVFDEVLRQQTETAVSHARHLLASNTMPEPIRERHKCQHCSLQPICLPEEVGKLRRMNEE